MSKSDGSTADYYELPAGCTELQDLISHRDLNAQLGEIFRACYRYGHASHSDKMRDAKKIRFYADAEVKRLEKLEQQQAGWTQDAIDEAAFKSPMPAGECENWTKPAPRMFDGGPIKDGVMYLVGEQFDDFGAPLTLEPAASIDDESARMQAIGQNGNTGEHYDDAPSWDDAPEWAARLAQDANGKWYWYDLPVETKIIGWEARGDEFQVTLAGTGAPNPNWRDTLQARPNKEA